ncbi:MAG TPA: GNAT family N-acetyltransferase [Gaiellaceae bacterium]|nr:GNAT family N-acetyltransferase [Gaiellaceae bacterium]
MIRRATGDDVDAIAALYERSFATLTYLPVLHTLDEHRAWFRRVLETREVWVWDDGAVRGFSALGQSELMYLFLDVGWTGRGIGSQLLAHAKERMPAGFTLWTFQENAAARRFYERHGLRAVEFGDGSGNEERVPDVRYEWRPVAAGGSTGQ